jgi:hypothetical protein
VLEAILFVPVVVTLMMGMVEIGKVTYIYYMLRKAVYTVATYVAAQQGVNFCDAADASVAAAKQFALSGTTDAGATSFLPSLTPEMIQVRIERLEISSGSLVECDCSSTGCDSSIGGRSPDFIVVSIPDGYNVTPRIPFAPLIDIPLRPAVRVPFGGT